MAKVPDVVRCKLCGAPANPDLTHSDGLTVTQLCSPRCVRDYFNFTFAFIESVFAAYRYYRPP